MSDETRVVLIKPGDVLLIGNVGNTINLIGAPKLLGDLKRVLGLEQIVVFEADIDIAAYEETR